MVRVLLLLAVLLSLAFLQSSSPGTHVASATSQGVLAGDADCNLAINGLDALGVASSAAELDTAAQCLDLADVNCDNELDARDMIEILRYVAELEPGDIPGTCPSIGSAAGLPPLLYEVDESIDVPLDTIPGIQGGEARPVAGVEDDDGHVSMFVANEVVLVTDDMGVVNAFVAKWNGTLLRTIDPSTAGLDDLPQIHLIRIDPEGLDVSELAADLREVHGDSWGQFGVSSEEALELMAAAADEAAGGLQIDLNWVAEAGSLDTRSIAEAASGPTGWSPNPFTWAYMNRGSNQDIGVADAWRALQSAGKLGNKVGVAILDGGFAPNADFPAGYEMNGPVNTPNPASCTAGSSCPWHGTVVTAAAMGVQGNGYGVAGPAGPVADATLTQSPSLDLFEILEYIFISIPSTTYPLPDVLNISAGVGIPRELCLTGICLLMDGVTRGIRALGVLVFAAAGNDNTNVDAERCIDLLLGEICYEKTTHVPCELDDVICVGGLEWDSTLKNPASNYGVDNSNTVDIYGPMVQYTTPTPDSGIQRRSCGTSCASPFTAGVAALIKAANPGLGAGGIEDYMMDYAHDGSADPKVKRWVNAYDAVIHAMGGNEPPELSIDFSSGEFFGGQGAYLSSIVTDPEERPFNGLPYNGLPVVTWTSSLDGVIGNEPVPGTVPLSYGTHVITETVTDSYGYTVSDTRTLTLTNDVPDVAIINPADGASLFAGVTLKFRATSQDFNRPSGMLDDSELVWSRAPVGNPGNITQMGTGHLLSTTMPEGNWVITLVGTDDQNTTGVDTITLTILPPPADLPPTAEITSVTYDCFGQQPGYTLVGQATDPEQGQLTGSSLVWTKTVNGVTTQVGTGEQVYMPFPGTSDSFTITLTATDSNDGTGSDMVVTNYVCVG